MLTQEELLRIFARAGAIRHGHFELSSGRHSGTYVQCALVLQYPRFAEKLGQALAGLFCDARIDAVVSPALGGVVIGQEVARALPVVEDVWTTGGSTRETIRVVEEAGARVVAAGALIDRSGGAIDFEVETQALLELKIES